MGVSRSSRLVIVLFSFTIIISLMLINIKPQIQYSVDEIMTNPDDYANQEIFIRGEVMQDSIDYKRRSKKEPVAYIRKHDKNLSLLYHKFS